MQIPKDLPLLSFVREIADLKSKLVFENYKCLIVQHLLGSTIPLIKSLEAGGMKRDNIHIVGKAYSSHPKVLRYLKENKYKVINPVVGYNKYTPYDNSLVKGIRSSLSKLINENSQPFIILDDAAKAIQILHQEFSEYSHLAKCVELTSRGAHILETLNLNCPVIDIATSWAKKKHEAQLIAESMTLELSKALKLWKKYLILRNNLVLLIGYGAIGNAVSNILRQEGYQIYVYDVLSKGIKKAENDGFQTVQIDEVISNVSLVIGCTGVLALNESYINLLNSNTLLVNMASSDLEFALWRFADSIEIIFEKPREIEEESLISIEHQPWRSLYKLKLTNSDIFVANGGFPIDFSGDLDPIPAHKIQLTRALVLAGAIQTVNEQKTGIIPLDSDMQHLIVNKFYSLQSQIGE